jgi:GTP cyclohydrolase II
VHSLTGAEGPFRVLVLKSGQSDEANPPCAAVFGEPGPGCLVRIHSRCLYGEVFDSLDCDCRAQLNRSLELIRAAGSGVLIYLDQEGRGAGLLAKARAYALSQELGIDSFSSYRELGLPSDLRNYDGAVDLLDELGLRKVTLLTNNPAKVAAVEEAGIEVVQRSLRISGLGERAREYLAAKDRQLTRNTDPPES